MKEEIELAIKWRKENQMGLCVGSLSISDLRELIINSDNPEMKERLLDMLMCLSEFLHDCGPYLKQGENSLAVCIKGIEK